MRDGQRAAGTAHRVDHDAQELDRSCWCDALAVAEQKGERCDQALEDGLGDGAFAFFCSLKSSGTCSSWTRRWKVMYWYVCALQSTNVHRACPKSEKFEEKRQAKSDRELQRLKWKLRERKRKR